MVVALLASGAPAASAATTLAPVADSYVDASAPTTNYGALAKLRTDGSPIVRSFLRFDVQGWVPGTSRATLRLTPTSSLNTGLQVLRVADTTWGERAITSATAPPLGSLVATTAPPKANQPVSVDVTSAISGNGLASLALGSPDTTAEALASREAGAATAPQLVIDNPDNTPPAPTLTGPADGATLNSATPSITGTAGTATGDEGTVTVLLWPGTDTSGAPQQSLPAAALAGGAFSVAPTTALTDGRYSVAVQQRDAAGNVGRSGTRSFTVDRQPPGPTATSPAAGATTADSTPTFSGTAGTAAGDSSSVSVRVWQGSGTSGAPLLSLDTARGTTGAFSVDSPTALADGLYTWRVDQTDAAGNTGSSPARSFTVDTHTTPPPGPVTLAPVADSYVDASAPTTNYGALAKLRTDGSPIVRSFLRFDVQGWVPGTSRATLRLTPTSNLNTGLQVLRVADTSWGERAITSATAPPLGSLVATTAPPKANQPVSVNVTAAISGNGPASLALASPDTTAEALASRESGAATTPQLVIDNPDVTPPAPALTAPSDGALIDNPAPLLSGTAGTAPGDAPTVTVFVWDDNDTDETPLLQLPAAALVGGSFSVAPPLPDGTYTWLAEQRDAAGNVGRSATRTFTVDTEAPAPALTAPADGSSTGDSTPALAGTAGTNPNDADHVSVLVWQGSDSTAAPLLSLDAARAGSGAFSVDVPDALPDGGYTAAVRQTDAAGHTGTSAVHAFTVDTATPAPTLTEPVDASTTTDTTPTFAGAGGTAGGDAANVSIQVWDGTDTSADPVATLTAAVDPATGAFGVDSADPLDGGTYTARAEQVDAAGNRGHSATSTFAVDAPDATAPKPSLTAPPAGSSTNDPTPTLAGKAGTRPGDADSVAVRVWSGTDTSAAPVADLTATRGAGGAFSVDAPDPLADGGYTARVAQDDAAGNHGASADVPFTVDTHEPHPTLTDPPDGSATDDTKPAFKGSAGTAQGDADSVSVLVWRGSSATGDPALTLTADPNPDGSYSVAPADPLDPGTYTARAEQRDAAGNHGASAATSFTVNNRPDPTIAAAGDISCAIGATSATGCKQMATSDLLLQANPAAVLALGDTQYESGQYDAYQAQFDPSWGRVKSKIFPAIGNHEYGNSRNAGCDVTTAGDPRAYACGYFDYFNGKGNLSGRAGNRGEGYYAFDVGQWRLYAVNANCDRSGGGAPSCLAGSPQEQWLRADLAAHPRSCQLMFMHQPLFTSDTRAFDTAAFRTQLRPLWDAFYQYGGDVALTGHSHFYERFAPQTPQGAPDPSNGIQQIIVGTGGRNVYDVDQNGIEPTSVVHNGATFGALQMTLHANSYDWHFQPIAGQIFSDGGSRSCH